MSVLGKQQVKVAAQKKCKMQLDAQHITTSNFLELQPVYYRHCVPGEHITINVDALSRLAPLQVPTFGRANMNLRAFYVNYRNVCPYFNEFVSDTYYSSGSASAVPQRVPYFQSSDLLSFFTTKTIPSVGFLVTQVGTTATPPTVPYDFYDGSKYYQFTTGGKRIYKIFTSLGYRLLVGGKTMSYNALALLAFARIYFDWYSLPQYRNSSSILHLQKLFSKNDPANAYQLTQNDFVELGGLFAFASYAQDYFTSAWDNPVSPANSNSSVSIDDISNESGVIQNVVDNSTSGLDTPVLKSKVMLDSTKEGYIHLTEYSLHLLHALNNYSVRHSMSGAREIDRFLVDFGIQLRSERLNRSVYIGSDIIPLQIGDVTQTSNTAGAGAVSNLGDYGGRGYMKSSKSFDYITEEFGMFIICSTIQPAVGYVQGFDRHNIHHDKFDFFNPSFDNLGTQGIAKGELYVSPNAPFASVSVDDYRNIFGFTPRYAEYKVGRDWLTGDFSLDSQNVGRTSWNLNRLFSDSNFGGAVHSIAGINHSADFCRGLDFAQYNRIFTYTGDDRDSFYLFFNFNVTSFVPALPLYDTYVFENEENHDSVTLDSGGTKLN